MNLSVVVAHPPALRGVSAPCLDAMRRELVEGDELLWVHGDAACAPAEVRAVRSSSTSRGGLYGAGLAAASCAFVAFTDAVTAPLPGWREAAVGALGSGARVVGGPVVPHRGSSTVSFAGFVAEYGPHAVAPFLSASRDVAANNVAYDRELLRSVVGPGEEVWKSIVNRRLAEHGDQPEAIEHMRVESLKQYGWSDVTRARVAHGRLYGAQRAATWSRGLRLAAAAAAATVVPALAFARLAATVGRDPALRRPLALSAPVLVLALTAWAVGECSGYVAGEGGHDAVF